LGLTRYRLAQELEGSYEHLLPRVQDVGTPSLHHLDGHLVDLLQVLRLKCDLGLLNLQKIREMFPRINLELLILPLYGFLHQSASFDSTIIGGMSWSMAVGSSLKILSMF
jgi:hypothetical protein